MEETRGGFDSVRWKGDSPSRSLGSGKVRVSVPQERLVSSTRQTPAVTGGVREHRGMGEKGRQLTGRKRRKVLEV